MGFVLAVVVIVATGKEEPDDPYFMIVFPVIIAGVGAVLASCQLLVLRRAVGRVRGWVAASAIGSGVAIAVALALPEGSGLPGVVVEGALHGVAVGIILGTAQWLALRRKPPQRAVVGAGEHPGLVGRGRDRRLCGLLRRRPTRSDDRVRHRVNGERSRPRGPASAGDTRRQRRRVDQ